MVQEKPQRMRGKCPYCGEVFDFPYEDRVDVVLFGNWRKYHQCEESRKVVS